MPKFQGRWPSQTDDPVLSLIYTYPVNDSIYYLFTTGNGYRINEEKLLFTLINSAAYDNTGGTVYPQPSSINNYFIVLADKIFSFIAGKTPFIT